MLPTTSIMTKATVLDSPLTYPVLAHAPEFHGQPAPPAETQAPEDSNGEDSAIESETPAPSTESVVETTVISEPAPIALIPDGLGESLFTILVAVPWVLIVLRMQLNPQSRL